MFYIMIARYSNPAAGDFEVDQSYNTIQNIPQIMLRNQDVMHVS